MSQDNMRTAILGGVLGGLTVPTIGAVVIGAVLSVLFISFLNYVQQD